MDTPGPDAPDAPARPPRFDRAAAYREIAERNAREHAADTRARRWFWVRIAGVCWAWALAGLVLGGWAFHVDDVELGTILLLSGQVVTLVGVLGTVAYALIESERRGWR